MGQQFDDLAKALARGESRRQALRKFVAGALGIVVSASIPASASADGGTDCKAGGKACKKDSQCCSGSCCNGVCCPVGEICLATNSGLIGCA